MPIKINVPYPERDEARKLGARWNSDKKSWFIPDSITDINVFQKWLPKQQGYLVKRPYTLLKARRICWKCSQETSLIALAAKSFYALEFPDDGDDIWIYREDPVIFYGIEGLEPDLTNLLTEKFPFFRYTFSQTIQAKYWANTCIHCKALQGDNYNFMMPPMPFGPVDPDEASLIEKEALDLTFDYYIIACEFFSTANHWFI